MTPTRYSPPGRGSSEAVSPIQRIALSGSTRNCQTVSGLAAIAISRSTEVVSVVASILLPLLSFCLDLERVEALVPELLQERLQLREPLGPRPVEAPGAVAALAHEAGLLQDVQVLRDRRPRHVEMPRDLTRGELTVADEREDLAPARRGDRSECGLHGP